MGRNFPGEGDFPRTGKYKKQQKEKKHKRSHECNQMKSYSLIIAL